MGIYTHAERVAAANISDSITSQTQLALDMLQTTWDRYFGEREQPSLSEYEAEDVGRQINVATTILFNALCEFYLETGSPDLFPGSAILFERADEYRLYERISKLNSDVLKAERKLTGERLENTDRRRQDACSLPDDQAIIALESLLKEAGAQT